MLHSCDSFFRSLPLGKKTPNTQTVPSSCSKRNSFHWGQKFPSTVKAFKAKAPEELRALSSVQLLSRVRLFATPWTAARQASLSVTNSWSLLKLMSIESVMPYSHLTLCHPLLLLSSIFPSIRVFSNESNLRMRWPKYWNFIFNISLSNEHPGLISFRMDWLDLLAVQGTLKSLLQHHSSKASIFRYSIGPCFYHQSHPQLGIVFALASSLHSGVISSLIFSSLLGTYRPGEFLFQYAIILPFHTVHGVHLE